MACLLPIKNDILAASLDRWGAGAQIGLAIEESAELLQALSHMDRGRKADNLNEEIADCLLCYAQVGRIYGIELPASVPVAMTTSSKLRYALVGGLNRLVGIRDNDQLIVEVYRELLVARNQRGYATIDAILVEKQQRLKERIQDDNYTVIA